uniref:SMP-30/Gluconolactonase/LRE-like region domain-containing protein n=1 Tax=Branchiostoma floridae TaxID=7739 RepID=C3YM90_BRAFL|eukprot:XP_002602672.1 hypothetical protein BRAFLDRAFT_72959 [Branchiostoma floridae]
MADDLPAPDAVLNAITDDLQRGNMMRTGQNVGMVESNFMSSDGNETFSIQPYATGYQGDDNDNNKPTKLDFVTANEPTLQPSKTDADIQPYAVAYTCRDDLTFITSCSGEIKTGGSFQRSEAAATSSNDTPPYTAARDASEHEPVTPTMTGFDGEIHEKGRPNPSYGSNTLYPDSLTTSLYNPNAHAKSNPIYPQNTANTISIHPQNDGNSNLIDESNAHPEPVSAAVSHNDPCVQPYAARYQGEDDDDNNKHSNDDPCIQPYAVGYHGEYDNDDGDNNKHTKRDDNPCIQPYAVRYKVEDDDDNNKHTKRDNNSCIQPYAVRRQEEDDDGDNNKHTKRDDNPCIQPYAVSDNNCLHHIQNPLNTLHPNPLYAQNANLPNPMYVPNLHPHTRCDAHHGIATPEKIHFGSVYGSDPGQFRTSFGVAVSADNEIFVTDCFNERVQVFSMGGVFLRLFPTVVPGDDGKATMDPLDVAIDRDGHLWVTEAQFNFTARVRIVHYDRNGVALTTFKVKHAPAWIAFDTFNNKVIVSIPDWKHLISKLDPVILCSLQPLSTRPLAVSVSRKDIDDHSFTSLEGGYFQSLRAEQRVGAKEILHRPPSDRRWKTRP